jgi:hypothetical protein
LFAMWLYSDIASTPSVSPSLRMLSEDIPCWSVRATAARSTRSRFSGARGLFSLLSIRLFLLTLLTS